MDTKSRAATSPPHNNPLNQTGFCLAETDLPPHTTWETLKFQECAALANWRRSTALQQTLEADPAGYGSIRYAAAPMKLLHISDLHIVPGAGETIYGADPYRSLSRVLSKATKLRPDAVLVTGDLTERADSESYSRLRDLLQSLNVPVFVLPGNHDSVRQIKDRLVGENVFFKTFVDLENWRLIFLDSRARGESHGRISESDQDSIARLVSDNTSRHVLIALHHTPIAPCAQFGCQLENASEFLSKIADHSNVRLAIAGHAHVESDANYRDIRILTTPSTCALAEHKPASECPDLEDFWSAHSFDPTRQGFRMIDLDAHGNVETSVSWI